MSDRSRIRPSHRALLPSDVTDPLLWRLAVDVLTAHQPGPGDRCANLQCADQAGPCSAARQAQRAMGAARAAQPTHLPQPAPTREPAPQRPVRDCGGFVGWFTAGVAATATRLRTRIPQRLPRRVPGATLITAYAA
ncbi:hypothetical protein AB0H28_25675 [Micromonospora sp. NPDC050980]|uniref:hypothetical protein n=1 Tax=Micromonospora sp. NPDC050980 TaxID=3155161 RepID=UPI0033CB8E1D